MKKFLVPFLVLAMTLFAGTAMADSLTPETYSDSLGVGESVTIHKTFTVDAAGETPADVMFLFDTTGSMGGEIAAATTAADKIMSDLDLALGDVSFGVAEYKDFYDPEETWGSSGDYPYGLTTGLTSTTADVTSALGSLTAIGGYDTPESGLYALTEVATDVDVGWRDDAARIVLWFGDAPSHDPEDTAGYPGPTVADTISTLVAEGITVIGVSYGSFDFDGDVTAVTDATGGGVYSGTTDPGDFADLIVELVTDLFGPYSEVSLGVVGDASGVGVTITPDSYAGEFDRSIAREFGFDVTFTGVTAGYYEFTIAGYVDGVATARELDSIDVGSVPEPATMFLLGAGFLGLGIIRKRFK